MPNYFLKGGTIIWPLLLSSVVARACLSLAEIYGPAVGKYPKGQIEADLEAVMCVVVNLVDGNNLSGPRLPILKRQEREAEVLTDLFSLLPASREQGHTWDRARKTIFG
ncbi:MAG: hypothetical protein ACOZF2_01925 [Thermodesulfobacteriota bacterium]